MRDVSFEVRGVERGVESEPRGRRRRRRRARVHPPSITSPCLTAHRPPPPPPSFPQFSPDGATATVSLGGETRAMATVTASLEAPYPDR